MQHPRQQQHHFLNFPIIDPHIHHWNPAHTPHAAHHLVKWLGRHPSVMDRLMRLVKPKALLDTIGLTEHVLSPYLPQHYAQDLGGFRVDGLVHVEANWHQHKGKGVVGETRWLKTLNFASQHLKLLAIVAAADPRDRHFKKILDMHQQESVLFRGIRKMASFHEDKGIYRWCDQAQLYRDIKFLKGFEEIAKRNLTFDAWCYSTQLDDVIYLAQQFPETAIVLDHLGMPAGLFGSIGNCTGQTLKARQAIFEQWKIKIRQLAEHPHVYVKISGLLMPVLGHSYHKQARQASVEEIVQILSPLIDYVITTFGIERVMFASNFPMDKPSAKLEDILAAYVRMIQPYGQQALYSIFHHNAKQFYQLGSI